MNRYYLGIDVSKGYSDFVIIDDDKKIIVDNFQLDDTFDGHALLYERIDYFFKQYPDSVIYSAVESTGGYENYWFHLLVKLHSNFNIFVTRLNPVVVNANSKANLQRIVTDKISAKNVAEYLVAHSDKVKYEIPDFHYTSARRQWNLIRTLTKQRTQLLNQLESLIYIANPGLLQYCKDGFPDWVLKLIQRFPTAKILAKANLKSVLKIPYLTEGKAKKVIAEAKNSVASSTDNLTKFTIISTVKQILHLNQTIRAQEMALAKEFSTPETELLEGIPGVGIASAIGLKLEIQNVERFPSVKKIVAFFGLHPEFKESGDGKSGFHMSKKGRKAGRSILYMVTLSAIQRNPIIKRIYEDRIAQGMNKMAAIGMCMHKLLRIIYGMLKNNTKFNPAIDQRNREKKHQKKKSIRKDKNRRYQDFDSKAPTSRRQHIKRKEQIEARKEQMKSHSHK